MLEISQSEQALEYLLKYCHVKHYPAKTSIVSAGRSNNKLFFILEGSVAICAEEEDGRELVYSYLNKGNFIGEVAFFIRNTEEMLSFEKHSNVFIKTRSPCKLAEISHSRLQELLKQESPEHANAILFLIAKQLAARLLITSRNFRDLAFMDTEGRIARTLLDLCQEPEAKLHPKGIQIRITRQELSRLVGCSREVAGRVLKELQHKKTISTHGKTIIVFHALSESIESEVMSLEGG